MTTVQETPSIGSVLRKHREDNHLTKAAMYRALEVSPGTYDTWEGGTYIPGDEHAERIAEVLALDLRLIVWMLYQDRLRPEIVVPLTAPLGRLDITWNVGIPPRVKAGGWFPRPIDIQAGAQKLEAA